MSRLFSSSAALLAASLSPDLDAYRVSDSDITVGDDAGADYSLGYLVGDIVGDIVGANRAHPMSRQRPRPDQGHGQHSRTPHGFNPPVIEYQDFRPTKMRKSQVGFIPVLVNGGQTATFTTQPQKPFRPERLVIPSSIGPFFTLADFKVGNTSQFVSPDGEMPALGYSEQAVDCAILSDTAFMSQFLVLVAHNIGAANTVFSAGFFGTSAELPAVTFSPRFVLEAFNASDRALASRMLRVLLDAHSSLCILDLEARTRRGEYTPDLYKSGVVYQREPPGVEDWQDITCTLRRKFGDCEDLVAYRVAELRARGIKAIPQFFWKDRADGGSTYHIQVQHPDGTIEDPSALLGMHKV